MLHAYVFQICDWILKCQIVLFPCLSILAYYGMLCFYPFFFTSVTRQMSELWVYFLAKCLDLCATGFDAFHGLDWRGISTLTSCRMVDMVCTCWSDHVNMVLQVPRAWDVASCLMA